MENELCRETALACLRAICADENAKHADRIAAARLLIEHSQPELATGLTVVMEGIPAAYCT